MDERNQSYVTYEIEVTIFVMLLNESGYISRPLGRTN